MVSEEHDVLPKVFKTLATSPVLLAEQLLSRRKRKFWYLGKIGNLKFPEESIAPGAWRALKLLTVFHHVYSVSNNALGALLFKVYGPKVAMATDEYSIIGK